MSFVEVFPGRLTDDLVLAKGLEKNAHLQAEKKKREEEREVRKTAKRTCTWHVAVEYL